MGKAQKLKTGYIPKKDKKLIREYMLSHKYMTIQELKPARLKPLTVKHWYNEKYKVRVVQY